MSRDRIFTLLSRKLADEATASELEDLLKEYPDQKLSIDTIAPFWDNACEKDQDFLEATYHLHLNRLQDRGFNLTETKTDSPNTNTYIDLPAPPFKQKYFKKLLAACAFLIIAAFLLFVFTINTKKLITSNNVNVAKINQSVGRNMITRLTSKVKIGKYRALRDDKEVNER